MRKLFILLLSAICVDLNAQVPIPEQPVELFKKRFTIYYVSDPNMKDPYINTIDPIEFEWDEKGIIFGVKNNNGMDVSAGLLKALFDGTVKESVFQDAVFYALQLSDKHIDLYFVNDVKGVQAAYHAEHKLFDVSVGSGKNAIWPATYKSGKLGSTNPCIVIGENLLTNVQHLKEMFCRMVARTCMGDYGGERLYLTKKFKTKSREGQDAFVSFPISDLNRVPASAIANAISLYGSKSLRESTFPWLLSRDFMVSTEVDPDIPVSRTLRGYILARLPKETGYQMLPKDFAVPAHITDKYRKFGDVHFMDDKYLAKYYVRNDVYLGLIYYEFIRILGPRKFIEALKLNNGQFFRAKSDDKIALLFENLCLVKLNGKTYEDLAKAPGVSSQGESFSMALFDIYAGWHLISDQSSLASDFSTEFEEITGGKISTGIAEDIIPYYLATWQSVLQKQFKTYKKDPNLTFYENMANMVVATMKMKVPLY